MELLHGAVLHPYLTDLPTHRHGDTRGLKRPDEPRYFCCPLVVCPLLEIQRRLPKIHQGRRVHIDIEEAGAHFFGNQLLHFADLCFGTGRIFLRVDLAMVTLNEERQGVSFPEGRGEHDGHVLGGSLLGIGNLRAGDLQNERPRVAR